MSEKIPDNAQTAGKWMMYLTWVIGLVLASYFFQNWIDHKRNPNQFLDTNNNTPVVLAQNSQGHYIATGTINKTGVIFLLDTGATSVVVSTSLASTLNLPIQGSTKVSTANGVIDVQRTKLANVSLGNLSASNIDALINPHAEDNTVLLGMSFLKHLTLVQRDKTLTLSAPQ